MAKILVVDDEASIRFVLQEALGDRGHTIVAAASADEALEQLDGVEAVLTDLAMPGRDGMALLAALRERDPSLPVVLLTAHGSERVAVAAMRAGAHDYLTKPFDIEELALVLERAVELGRLRGSDLARRVEAATGGALVGRAPAFLAAIDRARRVAARDVTVLLRGATGTGKELVAAMIHAASHRRDRPLVRFNCAAVPAELAESELFGHVRGAFTGAAASRDGVMRAADGGTLVLDEIGELPLGIQAKLLRAVQQGEIQPVGSDRVVRVDLRVIASTHRDLAAEVAAGRFREDLYYRLAVVDLVIPGLESRVEDIAPLIEHFRRRYAVRFDLGDVSFTPAVVDVLRRRAWPGNVRELENTVARLLALATGGVIDVDALDDLAAPQATSGAAMALRDRVAAFERSLIEETLDACAGNQSETARRLGLSRITLHDKLRRYGLLR